MSFFSYVMLNPLAPIRHCAVIFFSFLSLLVVCLCYNRIFLMGDFHFPALFYQALVILQLLFSSHNAAVALAP